MKTREQEEKRHEIMVGLMILVGIGIIVFVIFAVSQQQGLLEERYELKIFMSRVNGLQTGAPVRLNGVRVGSVTGIGFSDEPGNDKIKVTIEIQKAVQDKIRANSEAYIGTLGLLGDKFISITMGTRDYPVLQSGEKIKGSDPIDVEKLIDESVGALDVLKRTTKQLEEISKKINDGEGTIGMLVNDAELYDNLNVTLTMLADMQREFKEGSGTLAKILRDSTMYDELYIFLKNANILTDSLVHGKGAAAKLVNDPLMYDELVASIQQLRSILTKIDSGQGTAGQLINDENWYNDLRNLTTRLDSLVEDVKKNPKRYLTLEIF